MVEYGTPPPRTVIGDPSQGADSAETVRCSLARPLPSVCRTKDDALGQHAIAHEVPQGDQQLARQGHDHLLARGAGVLSASFKPLRQGALVLELNEAPRELDHSPPHPSIAGNLSERRLCDVHSTEWAAAVCCGLTAVRGARSCYERPALTVSESCGSVEPLQVTPPKDAWPLPVRRQWVGESPDRTPTATPQPSGLTSASQYTELPQVGQK